MIPAEELDKIKSTQLEILQQLKTTSLRKIGVNFCKKCYSQKIYGSGSDLPF